jgi:hypothetical protein
VTLDGGGGGGPYESATEKNTSLDWLDNMKPVDVQLDGMTDFAGNMMTIFNNLKDHNTQLMSQMGDITKTAFGGGFPEIGEVATLHSQNLNEFVKYNGFLMTALTNIGNAAQTVADAYSSTDGWSAASLSAVEFAYGDKSAARPPGLPPGLGKTFYDKYFEDLAADNAAPTNSKDHTWTLRDTKTDPATGTETTTFVDQDGATQTISVTDRNGVKTTTIEVGGKTTTTVESTFGSPYGSTTTKTVTTPDGKTATSESGTSYTSDGAVTTEYDKAGKPTSSTTVKYSENGDETDTQKSFDSSGKPTTTSSITYGQESTGVGTTVDSPAADVEKDLNKTIQKAH